MSKKVEICGTSCNGKVNDYHVEYVENEELFFIMFVVSRDLAMSSCLHLQIVSQAIHSIRSFSYSFAHVYRTLFFFFLILSRTHVCFLFISPCALFPTILTRPRLFLLPKADESSRRFGSLAKQPAEKKIERVFVSKV